jgi:hypothetical protein
VTALDIRTGSRIANFGAGAGIFSRLFTEAVRGLGESPDRLLAKARKSSALKPNEPVSN